MSESRVQLNERKIRNGARRGAIKGERTMRYKTWQKLKTPARRKIRMVAPPQIAYDPNAPGDGMVYYGTNKPFVREEYDEEAHTVYVDEWLTK